MKGIEDGCVNPLVCRSGKERGVKLARYVAVRYMMMAMGVKVAFVSAMSSDTDLIAERGQLSGSGA